MDYGITYKHIDLNEDGSVDFEEVVKNIHGKTKMIGIQRSKGYSDRPSFMVDEIGEMIRKVKAINPELVVFVIIVTANLSRRKSRLKSVPI